MEPNSNNGSSTNNHEFDSGFLFNLCSVSRSIDLKFNDSQQQANNNNNSVKIASKRDDLYYAMDNAINGRCIILNYEHFDAEDLNQRRGTDNDVKKLIHTFQKLKFNVEIFNNLTYQKTFEVFKNESAKDHSSFNCFAMCILTHGSNGILHTKDRKFDTNKMFEFFTGQRCKTLLGKPKLFFIQACQGEEFDSGVLAHDAPTTSNYFMLPNYADFLIFYSTFPGYYSWRNVENGSWFMQTLCDVLDEYAGQFDLMTLLTIVCQKVAINYESRVPNNVRMHGKKQIPCLMSTLTRLISL